MDRNDVIREIQLAELAILKQFIAFADQHNIMWYACGGTVLGAVRHRGFIPWDDDIDIGVPRKDYERFLSLAEQKRTPFRVRSYRWDSDYFKCHSRIEDRRIKIFRSFDNSEENCSEDYAWIDITPLDGMPTGKMKFKIWTKYLLFRRACHRFATTGSNEMKVWANNYSVIVKALYKMLFKLRIYKLFNPSKECKKLDKASSRYSNSFSMYYAQIMGGSKEKDIYYKEIYSDGQFMQFEDIQIRCPKQVEIYLNRLYGSNYMSYPPENQRNRHGVKRIEFINYKSHAHNGDE